MKLYPLQFEPILKERIWGGIKLKTLLEKSINSNITGESWEISTVQNEVSIVANGSLKGKSLVDLISDYPEGILGKSVYNKFGKQFPLLFKYIDAREDLSIQVHPNDVLAKKNHNSFGKTEMWFVIQADEDSRLILGFKEDSSPESYLEKLNNKSLLDILDTKIVNSGTIRHATGILLLYLCLVLMRSASISFWDFSASSFSDSSSLLTASTVSTSYTPTCR